MDKIKATNITWHQGDIKKDDRERLHGHRGFVLWFTGLSGSGKSTLAHEVENRLFERKISTYVCDGDNIRHGLNKNLGFSPEDRDENIRRIGEVAHLFADAGIICLTAFISPYRADRNRARALQAAGEFVEVYCKCSIDTCESRDVKGLYKKAREGKIPEFTGVSAPYEEPLEPEVVCDTGMETLEQSANKVLEYLESKELIPRV